MFKWTGIKTFIQEKDMDIKMLPEMHRYVIKVEKLSSIFETVLLSLLNVKT